MMGEHGLAEDRAELEYLYKVKSMEKEGWRKRDGERPSLRCD